MFQPRGEGSISSSKDILKALHYEKHYKKNKERGEELLVCWVANSSVTRCG